MNDESQPVFIIGGSRTGSEMLKTMLSASNELDFVDELFLLCPRWLHKDLETCIRQRVGSLSATGALDRLVNLLYSGYPFGWFFSVGIKELDQDALRVELSRDELSLKNIFRSLMVVHAKTRNKSGIGAKFPLHYSYSDRLLEWFPNALLIHTTRNPKATYASQAAKYTQDLRNNLARGYMRFRQFVHINIQITWTARLHQRLKHHSNYCLVRYEDLVRNSRQEMIRICDFVGTDFVEQMLNPNQYGSSFDSIGGRRGVDKSSLERWRTSIHPLTATAIDILHPSAARQLGYTGQDE